MSEGIKLTSYFNNKHLNNLESFLKELFKFEMIFGDREML